MDRDVKEMDAWVRSITRLSCLAIALVSERMLMVWCLQEARPEDLVAVSVSKFL